MWRGNHYNQILSMLFYIFYRNPLNCREMHAVLALHCNTS